MRETIDDDFRRVKARYNPNGRTPPTLGNYRVLLADAEKWRKLGWPIDHGFFMARLTALNEARNDFVHFEPDPLTPGQLESMEGFVRLLRAVDPRD